MEKIKTYKKFCTGCGLCHAINGTDYSYDEKGFYYPDLKEADNQFCDKYCPASGKILDNMKSTETWGFYERVYVGWASNETIRHKASSGGILTGICTYLLDKKKVDGIIHVAVSKESPIKTEVSVSYSVDEVLQKCGSRYTTSSPLINIGKLLDNRKKYAFIGKPCDVYVLRQYIEDNKGWEDRILYLLSFFCAGMPSIQVNRKLLAELNCREEAGTYLTYRGNGWPGFAIAKNNNDEVEHHMTYAESWGNILGRELNPYCRFCFDGVGCFADISCGDAWYRNKDGTPDFSEHQGRNVIFCRNNTGEKLVMEATKAGYIIINDYNLDELKDVQKHQFNRKKYLYPKLLGMKLSRKPVPFYKLRLARQYSREVNFITRLKITLGMIKRIFQGKLH